MASAPGVVQPAARRPFDMVPADAGVVEKLGLEEGAAVLRIERLRSAGELPVAALTNYLPERVVTFSTDDLERRGLYELLRLRGVHLHSAVQTVGARTASAAEGRRLRESPGAPVLIMQRVSFDDQGCAVEWGDHV